MKRSRFCLYYIIFLMICLVGVALPVAALGLKEGEEMAKCDDCQVAFSKTQEAAIVDHCEAIKDDLRKVQKSDARARVYLGGKYETILNKFVMPLNVRLVENNLSKTGLIESQNTIANMKAKFSEDYVDYQQRLEELVMMDCKSEPEEFYNKLGRVRQKRKAVEQDMQKIASALEKYVALVKELKGSLKTNAE